MRELSENKKTESNGWFDAYYNLSGLTDFSNYLKTDHNAYNIGFQKGLKDRQKSLNRN